MENPAADGAALVLDWGGPLFDVEPEAHPDRVLHLLGEVADEAGGAGQQGESPDDGRGKPRSAQAAPAAPAPLIGRALPVAAAWASATVRRSSRCGVGMSASRAMA